MDALHKFSPVGTVSHGLALQNDLTVNEHRK
jgi:hypothetical protein